MRRLCQWIALGVFLVAWAGCGGGREAMTGGESPGAGALRAAEVGHLQAAEARSYLAEHPEALVLDVRNPEEWNDELGHIEGARQIPLGQLAGRLSEIEAWKEKPIVLVCRSGNRSQRAAELLREAGYREIFNLDGGMRAWRATEGRRR